MNKLRNVLVALVALGVPIALGVGMAHAQAFKTHTDENQVIDSSLYSAGQSVDIHGTINGDVYCAGQHVIVDATVHGDVLCAGQDVSIKGHVDGSVRVGGQNVIVEAQIGRSLNVASQQFTLEKHARVGQDATIAGSMSTLKGQIGRDALIASGTSRLENMIGRNLRYTGSNLTLSRSAHIKGGLTYESKHVADIASGAQIDGSLNHTTPAAKKPAHRIFGVRVAFALFVVGSMLLFSMLLIFTVPQTIRRVYAVSEKRLGKSLLIGLATFALMPLIILALCITVIGLPLGLFVLMSWIMLAFLSGPITAYYIGAKILRTRTKDSILMMLAGSAVLMVLYFIPGIDILTVLFVLIFGTGALLLSIKHHLPKPKYRAS